MFLKTGLPARLREWRNVGLNSKWERGKGILYAATASSAALLFYFSPHHRRSVTHYQVTSFTFDVFFNFIQVDNIAAVHTDKHMLLWQFLWWFAKGVHLFPYRAEKLSPSWPMVLHHPDSYRVALDKNFRPCFFFYLIGIAVLLI